MPISFGTFISSINICLKMLHEVSETLLSRKLRLLSGDIARMLYLAKQFSFFSEKYESYMKSLNF